jgi:hypothetical protein
MFAALMIVCVYAAVGWGVYLSLADRRERAAARAEAEAGFFGSASVSVSMRPHAGASRERLEEYRRGIQQQVDAVMRERGSEAVAANWDRERENARARVRRTRERLRARRDIDAMII